MSFCFICETPYQVLNCLNYIVNSNECKNQIVDMYIGKVFSMYDKVLPALRNENIASNIYAYDYARTKTNVFLKRTHILLPKLFINRVVSDHIDIKEKNYTHIFVSTLTDFAMGMIFAFPKAKVCYYDDGIGSYWKRIGMDCLTQKKLLYFKLLRKNYQCLYPQVLYVNNCAACNSEWEVERKPLPSLSSPSSEFLHLLYRVFGNYPEQYNTTKLIYLSQPFAKNTPANTAKWEMNQTIANLLKNYPHIFRPHPREKIEETTNLPIDRSASLWELICLNAITDDHVLISYCSTAQFIPKQIFNKEPTILFTYKLYENSDRSSCNRLHQQLRSMYQNPEKVRAIESLDELEAFLHSHNAEAIWNLQEKKP